MVVQAKQPYVFAQRSQHLQRSVMRELLAHAVDPDILSLAGGLPADDLLPVRQLQDCASTVLAEKKGQALQYGPPFMPLREWLADYMTQRGVPCGPQNIFITNGNQQGLQLLSQLFLDPGQVAVTDQVVFTGVQQVTAGAGAEVRTIPFDPATGADLDALEQALAEDPKPRLAVLIPDFHNPLGVSLPPEKRERAAQLAAQYAVPLIEDDAYAPLRFAGDAVRPIKAYDEAGWVFYIGSFSKIVAPGLRLGWLVIPENLYMRVTTLREALDLETSQFIQRVAYEFLQRGYLRDHLTQLNAENARRWQALDAALKAHLGEIATWTQPTGGLFCWLTLNDTTQDTWALMERAIANKVVYIPGAAFTYDRSLPHTMRLNFSRLRANQFDEAVRRLQGVLT